MTPLIIISTIATMKKLLIILLTLVTLSVTAQLHSEWHKNQKNKVAKTAICVGTSLASVALEMTGDALYDMGKESGNVNQMHGRIGKNEDDIEIMQCETRITGGHLPAPTDIDISLKIKDTTWLYSISKK